jgi:tRNA threonylcarbamoyladenosine biosynthesis protein TsaE
VSDRLRTETPEATRDVAARLAQTLGPGDVVALSGELGAGKTCFVQGLAAGLGITGPITSPTFILVAEYVGRLPLYHVDLYRTASVDEIRGLGLEEMLDGEGLTVIEWAEKAEALLPDRAVRVHIHGVGDEPREIELAGLDAERARTLRLHSSSPV